MSWRSLVDIPTSTLVPNGRQPTHNPPRSFLVDNRRELTFASLTDGRCVWRPNQYLMSDYYDGSADDCLYWRQRSIGHLSYNGWHCIDEINDVARCKLTNDPFFYTAVLWNRRVMCIITGYIMPHCYSMHMHGTDYKITGVCVSVCHRSCGRNFESNLVKLYTVVWGPGKLRSSSLVGSKSDNAFLYFTPMFTNFHHFNASPF